VLLCEVGDVFELVLLAVFEFVDEDDCQWVLLGFGWFYFDVMDVCFFDVYVV